MYSIGKGGELGHVGRQGCVSDWVWLGQFFWGQLIPVWLPAKAWWWDLVPWEGAGIPGCTLAPLLVVGIQRS